MASCGAASNSAGNDADAKMCMRSETDELVPKASPNGRWIQFSMVIFGPGIFCSLADTDAGCLITAAESGAKWRFSFLLTLQFLLIPILFFAQELTVRLGVYSKKGHTACIRDHFGISWACFAAVVLFIECTGAMISEMSGIAMIAELWGATRLQGASLAVVVILFVILFLDYKHIEMVGVICGLFELTFVLSMFLMRPSVKDMVAGSITFYDDHEFVMLVSSNIGAVVMPWMIYFQQSAVVARRLSVNDIAVERGHTLLGSALTQLVMIGVLVTMATAPMIDGDLSRASDFVKAISPTLGEMTAKIFVSLAFVGGSFCAAFIVAVTPAWAFNEVLGIDDSYSLDRSPLDAPQFYFAFVAVVSCGFGLLCYGVDIVELNLYVELMDGLLLPFALGFLYLLATTDFLPPEERLSGVGKYVLGVVFFSVICISVASGGYGLYWELFVNIEAPSVP